LIERTLSNAPAESLRPLRRQVSSRRPNARQEALEQPVLELLRHPLHKQHEAVGRYHTSVFFPDEVTALAAGHRPCFFCRRKEARHFLSLAAPPMADAADLRIAAIARVR
jgi:hypothetical protein